MGSYPLPGRMRVSQIVKACCMTKVEFINFMLTKRTPTEDMLRGTYLHGKILENKVPDSIAVLPYSDWRTAKAREDKEAAIEAGKDPITESQAKAFESIKIDPALIQEFQGYDIERPFFGTLEGFGPIQGKLDASKQGERVRDLKNTTSDFFKKLHQNIYDRGYDIQLYLYMQLCRACDADLVLFDWQTGCWCSVEFELEDMHDICQPRLFRGLENVKAWKAYQHGDRRLENVRFEPPTWAGNELLCNETIDEEQDNDTDNDARTDNSAAP